MQLVNLLPFYLVYRIQINFHQKLFNNEDKMGYNVSCVIQNQIFCQFGKKVSQKTEQFWIIILPNLVTCYQTKIKTKFIIRSFPTCCAIIAHINRLMMVTQHVVKNKQNKKKTKTLDKLITFITGQCISP